MRLLPAIFVAFTSAYALDESSWRKLVEQGMALKEEGNYHEARELVQRALKEAGSFKPDDARLAFTLTEAGSIELIFGNGIDAERLLLRAIRILEPQLILSMHLANALNSLALVYARLQGRYAEAEKLQERAVELIIQSKGPRHPDVGLMVANLAGTRWKRGNTAGSKLLYEQAIDLIPQNNPIRATNEANLGLISLELNEPAKACDYLNVAISKMESLSGAEHPGLIAPLHNLAHAYMKLKQQPQAEAAIRRALRISEVRIGAEDPELPIMLRTMATILRVAGDKKQAREFEKRARTIETASMDKSLANGRIHVSELTDGRRK